MAGAFPLFISSITRTYSLSGFLQASLITVVNGPGVNSYVTCLSASTTGRICPIGVPEVEPRYLTTRILYEDLLNQQQNNAGNNQENDINLKYSRLSRPYVYSKAEAWGYYLTGDKIPANSVAIVENSRIPETPLSYNGYIKSKISPHSHIYDFLGEETMQQKFNSLYGNSVEFRGNFPNAEEDPGYGCSWGTSQECEVVVDKYVQ